MTLKNNITIQKLVIKQSEIDSSGSFQINTAENLYSCYDCNSNLCYIKIKWGVVDETNMFQIVGDRSKQVYAVREIGFETYCAECGSFNEHYTKWFYPEDVMIMTFDELDNLEKHEIEHCLVQFNQKGDFTPLYKCPEIFTLKNKLLEYEKKHKIKGGKKK